MVGYLNFLKMRYQCANLLISSSVLCLTVLELIYGQDIAKIISSNEL